MPTPSSEPRRTGDDGHYFSPRPAVGSRPQRVRLDLPDRSLVLGTDRGVFSAERVDPGTKLLLMELPPPEEWPAGAVLDLGCGYGPIACTLALRDPTRDVWAVDVNERARELCAANVAAAGGTVRVAPPDEVPGGQRFALVVSNPPIRIGKVALHDLLRRWLGRLTDDGEAWLVVQKHLGADSLARWLLDEGHGVERIRSRQGYRILRVRSGGDTRAAGSG
ncbi:MAG: class I SAM-dependent methyltransferase [Microthrixaceae bacterium]